MSNAASQPVIEYFYAAHSVFAYLGSAKFMDIARKAGRRIVHKPFDYTSVVTTSGAGSTRERGAAHRSYYFGREIERWAEWRDVAIMDGFPEHHFANMDLASGVLIATIEGDQNIDGQNINALAHSFLEAHWRDDADLSNADTLTGLIQGIGLDPKPLLDAAMAPDAQAIFKRSTEEAITRSVFGSPTYFVDGDMFYGQDHLEMVERALVTPFKGEWPRN
jgi:2-hydroxychromene-2-carboxylate isomerase